MIELNILLIILNSLALTVGSVLIFLFFIVSIKEKEFRAALIAFVLFSLNAFVWSSFTILREHSVIVFVNSALFISMFLFSLVSLIKFIPKQAVRDKSHIVPYDERDHMFSRNIFRDHPEIAPKYYVANPEKEEFDKANILSRPNLGEPGALYYDKYRSAIFEAAFTNIERTRNGSLGEANPQKHEVDVNKMALGIKEIARLYGAVDVGITQIKPYHLYTYEGRRHETWGNKIVSDHTHAIVVVVAMDTKMVQQAPKLPIVIESSRKYVASGYIVDLIAEYIRYFGYDARGHKDGFYQTICVPLAIDAGLGRLGRLGILMHPVYGPCIRLAVTTTNLPLPVTNEKGNLDFIDQFCKVCKKCAENCPTQSIVKGDEETSRGFSHWSINQEKCYAFWKKIGTDCGFCIKVCPYAKPNTFIHNMIRFYISRNSFNQHLAVFMDSLFYGRKVKIGL